MTAFTAGDSYNEWLRLRGESKDKKDAAFGLTLAPFSFHGGDSEEFGPLFCS